MNRYRQSSIARHLIVVRHTNTCRCLLIRFTHSMVKISMYVLSIHMDNGYVTVRIYLMSCETTIVAYFEFAKIERERN